MTDTRFVLASASPRRHELLARLGLDIEVAPAEIDEARVEDESPDAFVRRLARAKADAVASSLDPDDPSWVVLGADTAVAIDDEVFGKPVDDTDAARILRRLSSRPHRVLTGVAAVTGTAAIVDVDSTTVTMTPMTDDEIAWYVRTGEPEGKAGAFAIQGAGSAFIERIEGSASNVVGLPLALTRRLLRAVGIEVLAP